MAPPSIPTQPESGVAVFATSPMMIANMACALSSHSLRFTGQRLQAHAQHLQALAQCESLQDLLAQQMAFLDETARQFSDGMARAMQPMQALSGGRAANGESQADEAPQAQSTMRSRQAASRRSSDGESAQSH